MIEFFVPGDAKSAGSKQGFPTKSGRIAIVEACKGSKPWRAVVSLAAEKAMAGRPPLDGPLGLAVVFFVLRPKSHFGGGKNAGKVKASAPKYPTGPPDTTKRLRALEDACKMICWKDDALIVDQVARKRYGERPGAMVRVWEMGEDS